MMYPDSPVVPAAPTMPGLSFRYFESPSDYRAMAAVQSDSAAHDQIDPRSSRETIPSAEDLQATFPESVIRAAPDLLLVTMYDQLIGYAHVCWRWTEVTGVRVYLHLGYLLPIWRGRGIGQAMLGWAQQRIRAIAALEQPDERATFATNVSSTEDQADALIRHAGYTVVRRLSDMAAVISTPLAVRSMLPGLEVRPVLPPHYRPIYQAMKDAYRTIWTSTPESDADYQAFLAAYVSSAAYEPGLWQIAWLDDTVVGVVMPHIHGDVGQILEVYVRPAWQRRGVARALLQRAFQQLHARGIEIMRLYTDADDGQGARSLYQSLGFTEVKQHYFYRKLLALP